MEGKKVNSTRPYLTFRLGEETYALEVEKVREVLELTHITKIPRSPGYMSGVLNLRGGVVSVVDLRLKFGMPGIASTVDTGIIILELVYENEPLLLGIIVDAVKEVLELDNENIEAAPRLGMNLANDFIQGIGKKEEEFLIILNIDKIFSTTELTLVSELQKAS